MIRPGRAAWPGRSRLRRNPDPGHPLLDAWTSRQLELLSMESLGAIIAGLAGERSGLRRPQAGEFADYRGYQAGDDPRLIDWNAYARLDELYVRTSPAQQRLTLSLLLDCSASMAPPSPRSRQGPRSTQSPPTGKLWYAKQVAAALGAVALLHSDAVRVCALGDGQAWPTPLLTGRHALSILLGHLARLPVRGGTNLAGCVRSSRQSAADREITVLLSDLLIPREDDRALHLLGPPGTVLHIHAPAEDARPAGRSVELVDRETGDVVTVAVTAAAAERYRRLAEARSREFAQRCADRGLRYIRLNPATAVTDLLFTTLCEQGVLRGATGTPHSGRNLETGDTADPRE